MVNDDTALANLMSGLRLVGQGMQRNLEQMALLIQLGQEMLARLEEHLK